MHSGDLPQLRVSYRDGIAAGRYAEPHFVPMHESDGMDLFRKLWRRKVMIVALAVAGGILATALSMTLTPRYTAESRVLLGVDMPQVADIPSLLKERTTNQEVVQSQSFLITSRSIAAQVVHRLALDKDPEFNPALRSPPAWRRYLNGATGWMKDTATGLLRTLGLVEARPAPPAPSEEERQRRREQIVVSQLLSRLEAIPLQRSHVVAVNAQSENPETAARIANSVAKTFIEQQMIRRVRVAENAGEWLDQRIVELRGKVENAERATEEYRRRYGLYETRNDKVTAQQLSDLNSQLIAAETQQATAEARLAQVERVERNQQPLESLPDVVNSPLIQALVQRQVEARRHAAELKSTFGPGHPKMLDIRAQLADIKGRIANEVRKVVQALRHEVAAAQERVEVLRRNQSRLQEKLGTDNNRTIRLRELERQAEAHRRLLVTFLERAQETEVQPNTHEQSSVMISSAAIPLAPSFPPTTLLQLLGVIGGTLAGIVIALFRENLDSTFRTTRQVEEATNLPILGVLPPPDRPFVDAADPSGRANSAFGQAMNNLCERMLLSCEARARKLVMLTSATPKEGKTLVALSLARLAARGGLRAIILDCDWRRPSVNEYFSRAAAPGLGDLLAGEASPDEVVHRDDATGAHAIFAGDISLLPNSAERFARLRSLLTTLSRHYDMVIIDTPPVLASSDALALARMADEVAFVVRWGTIPRHVTIDAIRNLALSGARFGGIILSEADPKQYRRYGMGEVFYPYPPSHPSRAA